MRRIGAAMLSFAPYVSRCTELRHVARGRRAGSLVVVVAWVLFLVVSLCVAIGGYVAAHIEGARAPRLRTRAGLLAASGVDAARAVLLANTNGYDSLDEDWANSIPAFSGTRVVDGYYTVQHLGYAPDGSVSTNYGLADEERRIHLNTPPENAHVLERLFERIGGLDAAAATALAQAVMDWKDADATPREGGAESDYYEGLNPGYTAHNGPFETIDELRLVRGMDDALLERLRPYITVYGHGRVNLNTADPRVIEVLALAVGASGFDARVVAEHISDYRLEGHSFSVGGSASVIRDAVVEALNGFGDGLTLEQAEVVRRMASGLAAAQGTAYRGVAAGWVDERPRPDRQIEFVVNGLSGWVLYWDER